eukprot:11203902-Lingulodinium_polyedra.AAC.1
MRTETEAERETEPSQRAPATFCTGGGAVLGALLSWSLMGLWRLPCRGPPFRRWGRKERGFPAMASAPTVAAVVAAPP